MLLVTPLLDVPLTLHQNRQTAGLFVVRDRVVEPQGRRIGPRGILEGKHAIVFDGIEQAKGLFEIGFRFPGEAYDDVGSEADFAARGLYPGDALEILLARVEALHGIEHTARAALYGKVYVVAEGGNGLDGVDDVFAKITRM